MGIFSDIVDAFMEIVNSVVQIIGEFLGAIFGNNPVLMAIAIFAVVWFLGPGVSGLMDAWFAALHLSNGSVFLAALEMIAAYPFVFGAVLNVVVTILGEAFPGLKRALAYVSGFFTFITFAYGGWLLYSSPSLLLSPSTLFQLASQGLAELVGAWWPAVSSFFVFNAISGVVNGDYRAAFVAGFNVLPDTMADIVDSTVAAVGSSLVPWVFGALGLYWVLSPPTQRVEVARGARLD